jgi:signal transduction histidine kinase/DNA-binding response OmpR family regulator
MGQSFARGFPELVCHIIPVMEEVSRTGVAQDMVESQMLIQRNGCPAEAFFTVNFNPLRGLDGKIEFVHTPAQEITTQKILDRWTNMINRIATPSVFNIDNVYSHIISSLETDPYDIPMAILYEADTETEPGKTIVRPRGQIGMPAGHEFLEDGQDLEALTGLMPLCRQAMVKRAVLTPDERFDRVQWQGFGQPSKSIVIVALTNGVRLFGFLVTGTNPYRPLDHPCEKFIKELPRMVSSVIGAAWDVENLHRKLQLENELHFSDMKVRHLVQHTSVGMAHAKPDGEIIWANDKFFTLVGASPDAHGSETKINSIYEAFWPEDRPEAEQVWSAIMGGEDHVAAEIRLKRLFVPPVGVPEPAQVQMLAFPYKENGDTVSGMVCTTDISRLKWAEAWQARIAHDAREAKKQHETFIDVVSHEMRNPLSAIVHCADGIHSSLDDLRAKEDIFNIPPSVLAALDENVSAASTILDCAKHQKRIIDDVLTLSRLESTLLSVKPAAVRPTEVVNSVMSMFEAELRSHTITTDVGAEPSLEQLCVEYLNLDPSRLTQILMNLLTNAIKFVKTEPRRRITVRYGATLMPPRAKDHAIFPDELIWATKGNITADVTAGAEWGTGEVVYLTLTLADTGIGMRPNEILNIFQRFHQANMKTHVTYGGSGLGLFVSKELTEKMGGEIGVMSQPGEGSTFALYIKTRRATKDQSLTKSTSPNAKMQGRQRTHTLRVLLVEDNLINQRVLRKQLTKSDCEVEVANHGIEALDILLKSTETLPFDIALMDVQMPVMDGLACMTQIRKLEADGGLKGRLPIVAVTANVRDEQTDAAVEAGADSVVGKPFKAGDLVRLMREVVGRANAEGNKKEREVDIDTIELPPTRTSTLNGNDAPLVQDDNDDGPPLLLTAAVAVIADLGLDASLVTTPHSIYTPTIASSSRMHYLPPDTLTRSNTVTTTTSCRDSEVSESVSEVRVLSPISHDARTATLYGKAVRRKELPMGLLLKRSKTG